MHRTDAPGNVGGLFSAGDPANGILPTILDQDWHNAVQENIAQLIEMAGIALVKGNHAQLRLAVAAMITNAQMTPAQILAKLITVDGAGSALDADLLDGQQGAYYLPAANYTAADVLAKLVGVDGSGSGLDADLVDGWHRDSIRDWNNLLNKPWNYAGQAGQPTWLWGSNDGAAYYVWNPANFNVNYANSAGWTPSAGNADTVDGYHGSDLAKYADFANNLNAPGYQRLPSGMIMQWCQTAQQQNVETTSSANFPIQFPSAVLEVQVTTRVSTGAIEGDVWYQLVGDPTLNGCTVMRQRSDNDADYPTYCRIFAVGR